MLIFSNAPPASSEILRQHVLSADNGGHEIWLMTHRKEGQADFAGVAISHFASADDFNDAGFFLAQPYREACCG